MRLTKDLGPEPPSRTSSQLPPTGITLWQSRVGTRRLGAIGRPPARGAPRDSPGQPEPDLQGRLAVSPPGLWPSDRRNTEPHACRRPAAGVLRPAPCVWWAGLAEGSSVSPTAAWVSTPVLGQVPCQNLQGLLPAAPSRGSGWVRTHCWGGWGGEVAGMVLGSVTRDGGQGTVVRSGQSQGELPGGPEQMCPRPGNRASGSHANTVGQKLREMCRALRTAVPPGPQAGGFPPHRRRKSR